MQNEENCLSCHTYKRCIFKNIKHQMNHLCPCEQCLVKSMCIKDCTEFNIFSTILRKKFFDSL